MSKTVKVRLEGNADAITTDFNGKRYCFKRGVIYDIPVEVYEEVILSQHVYSRNLVPVQMDTKKLEEDNEMLKETNKQLREENKKLQKEVKNASIQSKKTR